MWAAGAVAALILLFMDGPLLPDAPQLGLSFEKDDWHGRHLTQFVSSFVTDVGDETVILSDRFAKDVSVTQGDYKNDAQPTSSARTCKPSALRFVQSEPANSGEWDALAGGHRRAPAIVICGNKRESASALTLERTDLIAVNKVWRVLHRKMVLDIPGGAVSEVPDTEMDDRPKRIITFRLGVVQRLNCVEWPAAIKRDSNVQDARVTSGLGLPVHARDRVGLPHAVKLLLKPCVGRIGLQPRISNVVLESLQVKIDEHDARATKYQAANAEEHERERPTRIVELGAKIGFGMLLCVFGLRLLYQAFRAHRAGRHELFAYGLIVGIAATAVGGGFALVHAFEIVIDR